MKQPEVLIEDLSFDFKKGDKIGGKEITYDPHIAYTLPYQGGAASGLNKPFILKAEDLELDISEEDQDLLDEIQKQANEDFNEIFEDGDVGGEELMFELTPEEKLSVIKSALEDEDILDEVRDLVLKGSDLEDKNSEDNSEVNDKEVDNTSDILKGDTQVEKENDVKAEQPSLDEVLKSAEAQEIIKALVKEQTKELKDKHDELQDKLKAKEDQEILKAKNDLTEVVKGWSVVEEDKIETIVKAIFGNDEASTLIETFQAFEDKITEVKKSFGESEHGLDGQSEPKAQDEKKVDAVNSAIAEIMKSKAK